MRDIDHIVYCVKKLDPVVDQLKNLLGIDIVIGGRHLSKGTHNAIFRIGKDAYFEILAPDPDNNKIVKPRWMGIDLIDKPTITRWAIKSTNLERDAHSLESYRSQYGQVEEGSRQLSNGEHLSWKLSDPLPNPKIEVVPFLLDWGDSTHPSEELKSECHLKQIKVIHNDPSLISDVMTSLSIDIPILKGEHPRIEVELNTPKGLVTLS